MNVLIQLKDISADREIREFTQGKNREVFITHSPEDSVKVLSQVTIDEAVISIKGLKDAAILKYINDYYPKTKVTVIINKVFEDVLAIFQHSDYTVIHEPLKLSELKSRILKVQPH